MAAPNNPAEKNRFGAVIVSPLGELLGAAFDKAPIALGSDYAHMGGDPRIDEIVPKGVPEGQLDVRDGRLDLRRSPCAACLRFPVAGRAWQRSPRSARSGPIGPGAARRWPDWRPLMATGPGGAMTSK